MARRTDVLSSRERVRLALEHKETDRIPIAMVCSGINSPAREALDAYLRRDCGLSLQAWLDAFIDIRQVGPAYIGPPLHAMEDIWGVRRKVMHNPAGGHYDEIEYYPLAQVETPGDLGEHRWPSTEWFDYSVLPERIKAVQADGEYCLMVTNGNLFEASWYMRGFQQMFVDMVLNPELFHAIMGRVTDFYVAHFRAMLAASGGEIDLAFTADDVAGQNGMLMSLDMWETYLKPYHVRLNAAIHEFGTKVIYHTDGGAMEAVEGLIDMGIDVLQALQFSAKGMDPVELKRRFGDRLCFEGGVSVQTTLPFGTVEEVRAEVEHLIAVLGTRGGYILGPSHAVQAGTPPENVVELFDTAVNFYPH
jgi:uroporphyrinogen decarboxylase